MRPALVELFRDYTSEGAGNPSFDPDVATPRLLPTVLGITTEQLAPGAYAALPSAGS